LSFVRREGSFGEHSAVANKARPDDSRGIVKVTVRPPPFHVRDAAATSALIKHQGAATDKSLNRLLRAFALPLGLDGETTLRAFDGRLQLDARALRRRAGVAARDRVSEEGIQRIEHDLLVAARWKVELRRHERRIGAVNVDHCRRPAILLDAVQGARPVRRPRKCGEYQCS
jgi:hypothetical protein